MLYSLNTTKLDLAFLKSTKGPQLIFKVQMGWIVSFMGEGTSKGIHEGMGRLSRNSIPNMKAIMDDLKEYITDGGVYEVQTIGYLYEGTIHIPAPVFYYQPE